MAHVAERLSDLVHHVFRRVSVEPDDHIERPTCAESNLVSFPRWARRLLAVQRDIHIFHARKVRPARISDHVAMLVEDAVRVERDHILSVHQPHPKNARRLHVEIALAPLESKKRRRAAAGVAERDLYLDAEEIERQKTAQVSARCGNARIVKGRRWMPEIPYSLDAGVARHVPDGPHRKS